MKPAWKQTDCFQKEKIFRNKIIHIFKEALFCRSVLICISAKASDGSRLYDSLFLFPVKEKKSFHSLFSDTIAISSGVGLTYVLRPG